VQVVRLPVEDKSGAGGFSYALDASEKVRVFREQHDSVQERPPLAVSWYTSRKRGLLQRAAATAVHPSVRAHRWDAGFLLCGWVMGLTRQ